MWSDHTIENLAHQLHIVVLYIVIEDNTIEKVGFLHQCNARWKVECGHMHQCCIVLFLFHVWSNKLPLKGNKHVSRFFKKKFYLKTPRCSRIILGKISKTVSPDRSGIFICITLVLISITCNFSHKCSYSSNR